MELNHVQLAGGDESWRFNASDIARQDMSDRRLIVGILALMGVLLLISFGHLAFTGGLTLAGLVDEFLTLMVMSIFLMGAYFISLFHRADHLRLGWVFVLMLVMALVLGALSAPFPDLFVIDLRIGNIVLSMGHPHFDHPIEMIALVSIWTMAIECFMLILGFGIIGILAPVQRFTLPHVVERIRSLKWDGNDPFGTRAVAWIFSTPNVLDTSCVLVKPNPGHAIFPWECMRVAVIWNLVFAAIMAVYVSLNPLFLRGETLYGTVAISSAISIFLPLLILPWFAYKNLGLRVHGGPRDYILWEGIQNRVISVGITLSTVFIILKWSLDLVSLEHIAELMLGYFIFNSVIAVAYAFIYFNFVDNHLTSYLSSKLTYGRFHCQVDEDEGCV